LLYSKQEKALKLLQHLDDTLSCTLQNKFNEVKDLFRYAGNYQTQDPLKNLTTKVTVIHDALHFYEPEQIYQAFLENTNLQTIIATTIIPPESIYELESSYPELYTLHYKGESLIYTPEGDFSGAYTQPTRANIWLLINRICGAEINLQVTVLESKFAHHIIAITRTNLIDKQFNNFGVLNRYWLDDIFVHNYELKERTVDRRVFDLLDTYAQSIKTLTFLNVKCKLRTLVTDNKGSRLPPSIFTFLAYYVYVRHTQQKFEDQEFKILHETMMDTVRRFFRQTYQFLTFQLTDEQLNQKILKFLQPREVELIFELQPYLIKNNLKSYVKSILLEQLDRKHFSSHYFLKDYLKTEMLKRTEPYGERLKHLIMDKHICEDKEEEIEVSSINSDSTPEIDVSQIDVESARADDDVQSQASTQLSFASTVSYPDIEIVTPEASSPERNMMVRELIEQNHTSRVVRTLQIDHQNTIEGESEEQETTQAVQPDLDASEFSEVAGNGILEELEVELESTPKQNKNEAKKFLKRILKSGVGCGFKTMTLLAGEEQMVKVVCLLLMCPPDIEWLGNQTKEIATKKDQAKAKSCTIGDFLDVEKILDVKFTFHLYSHNLRRYNCTPNSMNLNVYHHGNNHWTVKAHNHRDCQPQELKTTLPQRMSIGEETFKEILRNKRRIKDDLLDPEYIHFKKYDVTLKAKNHYTEKDPNDIPRDGQIKINELAAFLDNPVKKYIPTRKRADLYAREMKNGTTGTIANNSLKRAQAIDALVNAPVESRPVNIIVRVGRGGCRKTQALVDYLERKERGINTYTVVVPKTKLRRDWNDRLSHDRKYTVKTFETALMQAPAEVVIFDEVSQLPPGYIDTFLRTWAHVHTIICLFDLVQTEFHEPHPDSVLNYQVKEEAQFAQFAETYENYTFRSPRKIARFLGYRTYSNIEGEVTVTNVIQGEGQILTCDELSTRNLEGSGYAAITVSSSQGATYQQKVQMIINGCAKRATEEVLNTAMTRAANHFEVVVEENPEEVDLMERYRANPFLHALLGGDQYALQNLIPLTFEEYQISQTQLKTKTTTPVVEFELVKARLLTPMRNREAREVEVDGVRTQQIKGAETSLQEIFLKHQQQDSATWKLTKQKRLRYAKTYQMEKRLKSVETKELAVYLEDGFYRIVGLKKEKQEFDSNRYAELQRLYFEKKLRQKPLHQMKNNIDRSLNDESINSIRLFLKGQTVGKLEKMYSEAKAGQSIACFKDAALITLAPIADYLKEKLVDQFPPEIFVNLKKNTKDFDAWATTYWDSTKKSTENDYEAFDQSQVEEQLAFECRILKNFSIPEELIEFYVFLKLNAKVEDKLLDIMRLTGEWCTFLFNTLSNLAYLGVRFNEFRKPNHNIPLAVGGDDMVANEELTESLVFKRIGHRFSLKAKLNTTSKPTFCGWQVNGKGIYKNPTLLFAKLVAKQNSIDIRNAIVGYAFDAAWLYISYEDFVEELTEEEQEYHKAFVRWVTKMGLNMTKIVNHIFEDIEAGDIDENQLLAGKDDKILQHRLDQFLQMGYKNYVNSRQPLTFINGRAFRDADKKSKKFFLEGVEREVRKFLEAEPFTDREKQKVNPLMG